MLGVFMSLSVYRLVLVIPGIDPITAGVLGFAGGTIISAAAGWLMYRVAFKPLSGTPPIIGLIASVGAGFTIRESVLNFFPDGRNSQQVPDVLPVKTWVFGSTIILNSQILIVIVSVISVVCLAVLIERTKLEAALCERS